MEALKKLAEDTEEVHRELAQEFLEKKVIKDEDLTKFLEEIGADKTNKGDILQGVQKRVGYLGFAIKRKKNYRTRPEVVEHCLVNTENLFAKGMVRKKEYKALMEIANAEGKTIEFDKDDEIIERLLDFRWVEREGQQIYLGSRVILELEEILQREAQFKKCTKCHQLIVYAEVRGKEMCRSCLKLKSSK